MLAVVIKRSFDFLSTAQVVLLLLLINIFLLWLLLIIDVAHARQAAVACFYVEDGMEIAFMWEMLLDKVEEGFSDVDLFIFAVWGEGVIHMMFVLLILTVGTVIVVVVVFFTFANSLTKDSHNTRNFMTYTFRIVCGFFNVPH